MRVLGRDGVLADGDAAEPVERADHLLTSSSGREAPAVRPMRRRADEQLGRDARRASSISCAGSPARSATSTRRREFDEFCEPTTSTRSQSSGKRANRVLAVLRRVADVARRRASQAGKRSRSASTTCRRSRRRRASSGSGRRRGRGRAARACATSLGAGDHVHVLGRLAERALDLLVTLVADEHDVEARAREAARLGVDLRRPAGTWRRSRRGSRSAACARTAGETPWAEKITVAPRGDLVDLVDEDRAALLELVDDVRVVDDLLAHVDRRAALRQRALDDLDRPRRRRRTTRVATASTTSRGPSAAAHSRPARWPRAASGTRGGAGDRAQRAMELVAVRVEHDAQRRRVAARAPRRRARRTPCRPRARRCAAARGGARPPRAADSRRSARCARAGRRGAARRRGSSGRGTAWCPVGPRSSLASTTSPGSSCGSSAPQKPAISSGSRFGDPCAPRAARRGPMPIRSTRAHGAPARTARASTASGASTSR